MTPSDDTERVEVAPPDDTEPVELAFTDDTALEDPVASAWREVVERWHDPVVHARFVELCAQLDRLADAAGSYREVREADRERAEVAQRQIDQIVARALATLELQREEPPRGGLRRVVLVVGMILALALMGSALYATLHQLEALGGAGGP